MTYNLFQVFNKEFSSFFRSKMVWFVFVAYSLLSVIITFFQSRFLYSTSLSFLTFFQLQTGLLTFIIPALTLKQWAEERTSGTIEMTFSLPISYTALTLGKFFAVWVLSGLIILCSVGRWISSALIVELHNLHIFCNYIGLFFICGVLCSISLCASSFAKGIVGAYVISLSICLFVSLFNLSWLLSNSNFSQDIILRAGNSLSFVTHVNNILSGQISASSVFYFFSITAFALWINIITIGYRRQ